MAEQPFQPDRTDSTGSSATPPPAPPAAAGDVVELEVAWSEMATYRSVVLVTLPDSYRPAMPLVDVLNDGDEAAWLDQTDPVEDLVAITAREIDGVGLVGTIDRQRLPRPKLVGGPFGQRRVLLRSRRVDPTLRVRSSADWPWPGQPAPIAVYAEHTGQPWIWWADQRGRVHTALAQCSYCKRQRTAGGLAVLAGHDTALICKDDPDGCAAGQQGRLEDLRSLFDQLDTNPPCTPPQSDAVVVVMSVSGGDGPGWPKAGVLRLTRRDLGSLLAEIDRVAAEREQDCTLLSVRRWDDQVRYTDDAGLAEEALGDSNGEGDWALASPDVLARFGEPCRIDCGTREVTHEDVVWTGYPKHGDSRFFTASLSRLALAGLLARLGGTAAAEEDPGR